MRTTKLLIALSMFMLSVADAQAQVEVRLVASSTALGSDGGMVSFVGTINGDTGDTTQAYDWYFNVTNAVIGDVGSPVVITDVTGGDFAGLTTPLVPDAGGSDFGLTAFGLAPLSIEDDTNLIAFDATFAPNTTSQAIDYDFTFATGRNGFSVNVNGNLLDLNDAGVVTFAGSTVTVAAIPEPSAFAGVATIGTFLLSRRRRRG